MDDPLEQAVRQLQAGRYEESIAASLLVIAQCLNAVVYSEQVQVNALCNVYGDGSGPVAVEVQE